MGVNIPFGGVIQGTSAAETLTGSASSDQIFAYEGADTVTGLEGNDVLFGAEGDDILNGNAGDDVLLGQAGFNLVSGGAGNDVLLAGADQNLLLGGEGADQLVGGNGTDALLGDAGNDLLFGGRGFDAVVGGDGNDIMDAGMGLGVHQGGAGADTFRVGNDILDNGQTDRIIALDFSAAEDALDLGDGVVAAVTRIEDAEIDLFPVVEAAGSTGFVEADFTSRLTSLDGGDTLVESTSDTLSFFTPDATGSVAAEGVSVLLRDGDRIDIVGVTRDELLGLLGT